MGEGAATRLVSATLGSRFAPRPHDRGGISCLSSLRAASWLMLRDGPGGGEEQKPTRGPCGQQQIISSALQRLAIAVPISPHITAGSPASGASRPFRRNLRTTSSCAAIVLLLQETNSAGCTRPATRVKVAAAGKQLLSSPSHYYCCCSLAGGGVSGQLAAHPPNSPPSRPPLPAAAAASGRPASLLRASGGGLMSPISLHCCCPRTR